MSHSEQWFGKDLAETVLSAVQGKNDFGDKNCSEYVIDDSPNVDEDKLIEENTLFEKTFILKHRSLFSEDLSQNRFIKALPMHISLKKSPNKANDPSLYRFKP